MISAVVQLIRIDVFASLEEVTLLRISLPNAISLVLNNALFHIGGKTGKEIGNIHIMYGLKVSKRDQS